MTTPVSLVSLHLSLISPLNRFPIEAGLARGVRIKDLEILFTQ
jgi:hypothetical protein